MNGLRNIAALGASILIAAAVAAFGAQFGTGEWYTQITKPSWNPPNWIFGPVWTALYIMMAVAAWLVWLRRGEKVVAVPLLVYGIHLVFNAAWSWLFFGLHQMGVALVEILFLELLIVVTMILFWRVNKIAGLLFIPYVAWVAFASFLNFTLWRLNT